MKHLRRVGVAIAGISLGTGILLACGDDAAVLLSVDDSGVDGRSTSDATPARDVNSVDDATIPPDSGEDDASDAGADVNTPVDAQADVEIPPVDAGSPDADAGDLAREFPSRLAAEACSTATRCCYGDPNLADGTAVDAGDAGHYQQAKCLNIYRPGGLDQSNPGDTADFTKLTYNSAKASECLGRMHVLACNANAAEFRALVDACYEVLRGTVATGGACKLTSECQVGNFCNTAVAGGTCEAIRAAGATCGDWTANAGSAQVTCSNRFSGDPPRFCRTRTDAGAIAQATWTCDNAGPNGSFCSNDAWCAVGVCSAATCSDFNQIYRKSFCDNLATP